MVNLVNTFTLTPALSSPARFDLYLETNPFTACNALPEPLTIGLVINCCHLLSIFPAVSNIVEIVLPKNLVIFPKTFNTGPAEAANAAIFKMNSCVFGSADAKASAIFAKASIIGLAALIALFNAATNGPPNVIATSFN